MKRALLVTLFAAILVLPPLGARQIVSGDEARFAVLAQDMLKRGTWFDARVRDQRYRNKPLMYPWAIKVVRTITLFRANSNYCYRFDSGWRGRCGRCCARWRLRPL